MTEFIFANIFAGNDNSKAFSLDLAKPPSIWRLSGKGKRLHIFVEKVSFFSLWVQKGSCFLPSDPPPITKYFLDLCDK